MTINELRTKRARAWEGAKAFLDSHRTESGILSAEDDAVYSRMEEEITALGKEISRLERQEELDAELNRPVNKPIIEKPDTKGIFNGKTGRASDEYKRAFWAKLRSAGIPTFGTPVAIPCAVSLSLDANGEPEQFYADGVAYYVINNNMGYSGDLEIALIPESFRTDVLKETLDNNGVLVENANSELAPFALLFEFDGDQKHIRHVLYNCSASRPGMEGKTNEDKKEVQTEKITIKATPLPNGFVKAKTGNTTGTASYNSWYSSVYYPSTSFAVTPTTMSIEQGESGTATLSNALGTVTAAVTKGGVASADVAVSISGNTATIEVDEDATAGSYTVTLTDGGRESGNTATITLTVTSA